ncbi:MAG: porin family protein [Thermoflexibacter sp.]|jgi:outer membrane protein|nr:porin family protein [Thermoflexibacter sp.]
MKQVLLKTSKTMLFSVVCLVFWTHQVCGQTNKGDFLLGGNLGFSYLEISNQKTTNTHIFFSPRVGYFPINNWAVGLNLPLSSTKSGDVVRSSMVGFGVFSRYYFLPNQFKLFVQAEYGRGQLKTKLPTTETTQITYYWDMGVGMAYFLSPNIGIEGILQYQQRNVPIVQVTNTISYEKANQVNFNIGLQIYFQRKK